jgi:hypothetical protein
MSRRKEDIIKELKKRDIDPVKLEKEIVTMLRKGVSATEISSFLDSVIGGEVDEQNSS